MSKSSPETTPTGKPAPAAGCTIFFVIIGMITFLASIFIWQGSEYNEVIQQIAQEEEVLAPVEDTSDKNLTTALDKKIGDFAKGVSQDKACTLELDVAELNLMIAHYDILESLRGKMYITAISEEEITSDLCFEVRAGANMLEFALSLFSDESEGSMRYLNGSMTIDPVIAQGSIFPIITDILPDTGNPVPPKMIKEFPTFLFTKYRNDEELAKVFHKLSEVSLSEGKITILSDPKIIQPDALPDDVSAEADRAFQLFGLLTFMFITTVAFLLWLRKRKQNA